MNKSKTKSQGKIQIKTRSKRQQKSLCKSQGGTQIKNQGKAPDLVESLSDGPFDRYRSKARAGRGQELIIRD